MPKLIGVLVSAQSENHFLGDEKVGLNVLVITGHQDLVNRCAPFLEQNGYKISVSHSVNEALTSIVSIQPHVILLDWNLKSTNVLKVYTYVTEKLKIPCLVFTEDDNPRTTSLLMKSRIKHTLFPPIGGQGIYRRIQILMRGTITKAHKRRVKGSKSYGAIKVSGDEVDSDTLWEPVKVEVQVIKSDTTWDSDESSNDGEMTAWKGTVTLDKNTQLVYFFKGPKKPEYNKALGKWDGFDEKCPILMQERRTSKEMSAVQEGAQNDKNIFSMLQKNPQTGRYSYTADEDESGPEPKININQDEINSALKTFKEEGPAAVPSKESKGVENILALCIKEALKNIPDFSEGQNLVALEISSPRFKGYLLIGGQNNHLNLDSSINFYKNLQELMKENGESLRDSKAPISVEVDWPSFMVWTKTSADFVISDTKLDRKPLFAFMSLNSLPAMSEREKDNFLEITYESWLIGNTNLTFDLYIHMPLNQKYILYLKKDAVIEAKTLSKFSQLDVKTLFIPLNEKNQFLAYCIQRKILSSTKI